MEFWRTKRASAKQCRLSLTWLTWPAKKVSFFLLMHALFWFLLSSFFHLSFLDSNTLYILASRHLGTPPHCSENMQVAQLGGGVQALVPRAKDPSVLWQQKRAEIIKSGKSFTVSFTLLFFF